MNLQQHSELKMPKVREGVEYNKKYKEDQIEKAVEAVRRGMPKRKAAMEFGVPRSTIQFRLSDKFIKTSHGPTPILTPEEEGILVNWIFENHRKGFPRRKEDVQVSVKQFLDNNPRENPALKERKGSQPKLKTKF